MPRVLTLTDNGELVFNEQLTNGLDGITLKAPAVVPTPYTLTLPSALPVATEFLSVNSTGQMLLSAGSAASLDMAYDTGRIITADAGPVEAAGAGGFLASHTAPVYGLETTGAERNYRLTAGQTAGILEIQVGDADGDISDDVFTVGLSLDGTNRRLGVGTVAPATLAHFLAPAAVDAKLTLEAPLGLDASVIFNEGATARWEIGYDDSAGGLVVGRLSFANSAVFVADTTGDVGIGELAPDAKLHVTSTSAFVGLFESTTTEANASFRDTGTAGPLSVFVGSAGNNLRLVATAAGSDVQLLAAGLTLMHLDGTDQRVGIGDTTPSAKLDIMSNVAAQTALLINQDAAGRGILIDSEATGQPLIELEPLVTTNSRGDIAFGQRTSGASAPSEGDVWYNVTDHRFEHYAGVQTRAWGTRFGPSFGPPEAKTIAAGVITATSGYMVLAAETGTADILDTITITGAGPKQGDMILLRSSQTPSSHAISVSHNVGNIRLDSDAAKVINNMDGMTLICEGSFWRQITVLTQQTV